MEVEKERRDFLGRWQIGKHGSNDYVLTSKQIVHSVQQVIAKGLLEGDTAYEELILIRQVGEFANQCGLDSQRIIDAHTVLLKTANGSFSLVSLFPALSHGDLIANQTTVPVLIEPEPVVEDIADTVESKYWVSISFKTGFRRLHLRHACGIVQNNCNQSEDIWNLKNVKADAICKPCSKYMDTSLVEDESSSSGSSSSESERAFQPEADHAQSTDPPELIDIDEEHHERVLTHIDASSVADTSASWMMT
jgi:hypothetical protein